MIDPRRFEKILDQLEKVEGNLSCMLCGSTITQEEFDQLEDAMQALRLTYIANREIV